MTDQAPRSTPFLGRTRELAALRADIERAGLDTLSGRPAPRSRVLLIAGRPGSGRTRLAGELARQVEGDYPGGVVRVRLTARGTGPGGTAVPAEQTARDILGALGVASQPGAGEDELTEAVRDTLAERRAMLVLDDVGDPEQVHPLIPDNRDCLVVAIAEGPLTGVADVRPCTVGGLERAAAVDLLADHAGETRVACDPKSAHALAEECGGHPAALTLAGGWLAARPETAVADAVQRLGAIEPGGQPLARAFRLVYESLPPPAAQLLRLLALAPAGLIDAHTASALVGCTVSAAQVTLEDCAAQGLVRPAADQGSAARPLYEIPACLDPLLRDMLEAHERPADALLARARMLERLVRLLHSCRAVTEPPEAPVHKRLAGLPRTLRFSSPGSAGEWLRSRQPALLAAARTAVADGELDTLARRYVAALSRALAAHRGPDESAAAAAPEQYRLHELVLDVAERRGLPREKAAALVSLGDLDVRSGRAEAALSRYRDALEAARAAGDQEPVARLLESLGSTYQELGDWDRAADWYGRALAQRSTRGELFHEARLRGRLGVVHMSAGRWSPALREWRAAAAACRRLGDAVGHARAVGETARVQEYAGRPREALHTCEQALEYARAAGDTRLRAALQLRIADTLDRLGDPVTAALHRSAAGRLLERPGAARTDHAPATGPT